MKTLTPILIAIIQVLSGQQDFPVGSSLSDLQEPNLDSHFFISAVKNFLDFSGTALIK